MIKCSEINISVTMILRRCIEWSKSSPKLPNGEGRDSDQQDCYFPPKWCGHRNVYILRWLHVA